MTPEGAIITDSLTEGRSNLIPCNKETFTSKPREWCVIDLDSFALDGEIYDQLAMLSYAIQQLLPAEFQSTDLLVSFLK